MWLKEQIGGDRFESYFERNQQLVPNCGRGERREEEGERLKVTEREWWEPFLKIDMNLGLEAIFGISDKCIEFEKNLI